MAKVIDVTLRQLRALLAVAKSGSFTRAAESMHITQSALSGLIRELESQLGVRLVDRSTRRAQLSEVGKTFHDMVAGLMRELDEALDNVDSLKRLRHGVVRIAAPQMMASTLMPEVISRFGAEHPDIEIHLADCGVEEVIQAVAAGKVDIGV
ncbi:MAG: LysR family transcriptional regulator, partial [Proteobacteria bacterium]|nr:LysR family transcriptional regulator [Pseudomonadota bacterium]